MIPIPVGCVAEFQYIIERKRNMKRLQFLLNMILCCGMMVGFGLVACDDGPSNKEDKGPVCDERCEDCRAFCKAAGDCGWYAEDGLWANSASCEVACMVNSETALPSEDEISCVVGALNQCSLYEYLDCFFDANAGTECEAYCNKLDTCCDEIGICTPPSFCSEICTFLEWPERECFLECDTEAQCSTSPGFMTCVGGCVCEEAVNLLSGACMAEARAAVEGFQNCARVCPTPEACDDCEDNWSARLPSCDRPSEVLFDGDGLCGSECNDCAEHFMKLCIPSATPGDSCLDEMMICVETNC